MSDKRVDGRRINQIARLADHRCGNHEDDVANWQHEINTRQAAVDIYRMSVELLSLREQVRQVRLALGIA